MIVHDNDQTGAHTQLSSIVIVCLPSAVLRTGIKTIYNVTRSDVVQLVAISCLISLPKRKSTKTAASSS